MSDVAIRVEGLSKLYRLGKRERYRTLRDTLVDTLAAPFRRPKSGASSNGVPETIWALKDVSFDVKCGEVIGIIGRNGAGKSTLLKILSRITEPTEGHATIRGRVGSLLEVGTGFHPELTGRENIYLNGAILGMKKAEILRKFDEIVAFAEVEKFIDTPVKHYSSGMYVRLAFAVAAHLEPEILIVDEVLAVGDAAFQKRCLGKMGAVAKSGRTVLFVSHNMHAVQRLCSRALILNNGSVARSGPTWECTQFYLRTGLVPAGGTADLSETSRVNRRGSGAARIERAQISTLSGRPTSQVCFGQPIQVQLSVGSSRFLPNVLLGFSFVAADGTELLGTAAHDGGVSSDLEPGLHTFGCRVDPMLLTPGRYFLRAAVFSNSELYDHIEEFLPFDVEPYAEGADSRLPSSHYVGYVYQPYRWSRGARDLSSHSEVSA